MLKPLTCRHFADGLTPALIVSASVTAESLVVEMKKHNLPEHRSRLGVGLDLGINMKKIFGAKGVAAMVVRKGLAALAVGACLGLSGGAQAGPVTGTFDPEFGPPLDNLSYRGTFSFDVPDILIPPLGLGTELVPTALVANMSLTLLETGNESSAVTRFFTMNVLSLNIDRALGHVIGFQTDDEVALDFGPLEPGPFFTFRYLASGLAELEVDLGGSGETYSASYDNYAILIRHANDEGVSRLGAGVALLRTVNGNDGNGDPVFTTQEVRDVPEPGGMALLLGAFGALALTRRARGR